MKQKIFGIGIGRTATKSLTAALEMLKYKCAHWAPDEATAAEVVTGAKVSRLVEENDAIIDTILPIIHYREYAERFPDAKFILTSRNLESWLQSMRRHMIRMRSKDASNYSAQLYASLILNGWTAGEEGDKNLSDAFQSYNQEVRDFFKDKKDRFLEMDIVDGDGWEKLCPFLGKPIPKKKFPDQKKPPKKPKVYNVTAKRDVLALATMILPRMELYHLEEWIRWHYLLGVRHIWIVSDKPEVEDIALGQAGGQEWEKKPWANFSLDLNDEEVRERIRAIIHKCEMDMPYLNVRLLKISDFSHNLNRDIGERQVVVANKISKMADGLVDWVGFIDIDELLDRRVVKQLERMALERPRVSTIRMMRQRLMGNRFVQGEPLKFSEITESWGVIPDKSYKYRGNGKSFVRPGSGQWMSPHRAHSIDDGEDIKSLDIQFMHFHGLETTKKVLEVGWDKIYRWAKKNTKKQQYDKHIDILKSSKKKNIRISK